MAGIFIDENEIEERVIDINRVSKVVKGGRRFSLTALVAVGDRNGNVGVGHGKGSEVPLAIKKASANARRNMKKVNIKGSTIPHQVIGKFGAAKVLLKPASEGTGIIAGGPVRAVVELSGIKNILAKSLGSPNPINLTKATIDGLLQLLSAKEVAKIRGVELKQVKEWEELEEQRIRERDETIKKLREEQERQKTLENERRTAKKQAAGRRRERDKEEKTEKVKETMKIEKEKELGVGSQELGGKDEKPTEVKAEEKIEAEKKEEPQKEEAPKVEEKKEEKEIESGDESQESSEKTENIKNTKNDKEEEQKKQDDKSEEKPSKEEK